jgi:hypothetical protein
MILISLNIILLHYKNPIQGRITYHKIGKHKLCIRLVDDLKGQHHGKPCKPGPIYCRNGGRTESNRNTASRQLQSFHDYSLRPQSPHPNGAEHLEQVKISAIQV